MKLRSETAARAEALEVKLCRLNANTYREGYMEHEVENESLAEVVAAVKSFMTALEGDMETASSEVVIAIENLAAASESDEIETADTGKSADSDA